MKIAIFTDAFTQMHSGVVTATINLAKGLADKGHKVYIIATRFNIKKEFSYKDIEVIRLPGIPSLLSPEFKMTALYSSKLMRYLKKKNVDIIHFETPLSLGMQAILIAKELNKPLVGTFHTFSADKEFLEGIHLNHKPIIKLMQNFLWGLNRFYYNRCDLITCPAKTTKEELLANGLSKNIKVISNGIDFRIFDNSKWKEVKKKYNKDGKLLLFIGRVAPEKNIPYLLNCFSKVVKKIPSTKLMIVGDGPSMRETKKKIEDLGIKNNVILTGKIAYDDLVTSSIFKACDLFVSASVTENQPMTVLEAQINGLPCIGINIRGMKDLIQNEYNGYLTEEKNPAEFSNRIIELLSNDKLRNKMKKNTLKEVKINDLRKVIEIWEETYKKLIDAKRNK
jgi:1,2-diacylglycerol 3-alpha-glucosyltransferase